jgi:GT2 family glycosyltransferase
MSAYSPKRKLDAVRKHAQSYTKWPKVSLIISNFNGKDLLRECLMSLEKLAYPSYEIIVVDAGSTDGAPEMVNREFPDVRLLKEGRIGIGEATNKALITAQGDIIAFDLNNDEVFSREWLSVLVNELLSSDEKKVVGGARIIYGSSGIVDAAGGRIGYAGRYFPQGSGKSIQDLGESPIEVTYVGTPVFKRELLDLIGLCDEKYYISCEDWDFCEKAKRAGYKVFSLPTAISYHRGATTVKSLGANLLYYSTRNRIRLFIKHYPIMRMVVASLVWIALMVRRAAALFPPARRIYYLIGIVHTHVPSRKLGELYMALFNSVWWNLENLRDHFEARGLVQLIKPS